MLGFFIKTIHEFLLLLEKKKEKHQILNIVHNTPYYLTTSYISSPSCTIFPQNCLMSLFLYLELAMFPPEIGTYVFLLTTYPLHPFL
jgi:hypothetical protein